MRTIGFFFILLFLVLCALDLPIEALPFMGGPPAEMTEVSGPEGFLARTPKASSSESLSANLYWLKYVPLFAVGMAFLWFARGRSSGRPRT
jgi:hypothetical protein